MSLADKPILPSNFITIQTGMTLRQYYAGLAMQALISKHGYYCSTTGEGIAPDDCSKLSIIYTESLIERLEKTNDTYRNNV